MRSILLLALIFVLCSCAERPEKVKESEASSPKHEESMEANAEEMKETWRVEILDKRGEAVISAEASIKLEASGMEWTEGTLWVEEGKYLLFSDIPNSRVMKLGEDGELSQYLKPSGKSLDSNSPIEAGSNGLILDQDGKLVLMQHADRRISKMDAPLSEPEPKYVSLTDSYIGKKYNSPNDACYDRLGNLYFTDPPYGLPGLMNDPSKELSFQGVYCLKVSGEVGLIDSLTFPNGIAVSPDGRSLYVAVSDAAAPVWYKYDIVEPGVVENKEVFFDAGEFADDIGTEGLPDGMKVNKDGIIFATGPGGVWIFHPDGTPLARIYTGQLTANCALTSDESRLYMAANNHILSIELK